MGWTRDENGILQGKFFALNQEELETEKEQTKLRWCEELEEDVARLAVETGDLMCSQERTGGSSLRRSSPTQGGSAVGKRRRGRTSSSSISSSSISGSSSILVVVV
jgi:hypothetical protein